MFNIDISDPEVAFLVMAVSLDAGNGDSQA
jgi:hypothetical protein